jgi:hypothetical protein
MSRILGQGTHKGKLLLRRHAKIVSDNENYDSWRDKTLIITHAANDGLGYDESIYPEMLCSFKCVNGKEFPFSLYEYEFELI